MVQNMPYSLKTFNCPIGSIHVQKYFRQRWIKFFKGLRSALATLLVPVLSKVLDWVMMGRPETCTEDIKPYYTRWHEIFLRTKLHSSVLLASHSPSIFRKDVKGVALGAPSHLYSESNSTHLCLVAQDEWGNWTRDDRYRSTPHSTPAAVPTELLLTHRLRTRLNQAKPDLAQTIEGKQNKQKKCMDLKGHQDRVFVGNDIVPVRTEYSSQ